MKVALIVVAGGSGSRMGFLENKLLQDIDNSTILGITLRQFKAIDFIKQVIVVHRHEEYDQIHEIVNNIEFNRGVCVDFISGGDTRFFSVHNGLSKINDEITHVFVHDGARPFVSEQLITRLAEAMGNNDVVIPVLKLADTIRKIDIENHTVVQTLDRSNIVAIQTPQCYTSDIAKGVYYYVEAIKLSGDTELLNDITDDASMIMRVYPDKKIFCAEGCEFNTKLTVVQDLEIARLMYGYLKDKGVIK